MRCDRRQALVAIAAVGSTDLHAPMAFPQALSAHSEVLLDSFAEIGQLSLGPHTVSVRTLAFSPGAQTGGARYRLSVDSTSPASPSRKMTSDGRWLELAETVVDPFMCGAAGDNATDDTVAMLTWASLAGAGRQLYAPSGTFLIGSSLVFDADELYIRAHPAARVVQTRPNTPGIVIAGSRSDLELPVIECRPPAGAESFQSIGIIYSTRINGAPGSYFSSIRRQVVEGFAVGIFEVGEIKSTLVESAGVGDTTVRVADGQTNALGSHPWLPGTPLSIRSFDGTIERVRIRKITGTMIEVHPALTRFSKVGDLVYVEPATLFSDVVELTRLYNFSLIGLCLRGFQTQQNWLQVHLNGDSNVRTKAVAALLMISDEVGIAQLNVEHLSFSGNWLTFFGQDAIYIGGLHLEDCEFRSEDRVMIFSSAHDMRIGWWSLIRVVVPTSMQAPCSLLGCGGSMFKTDWARIVVETFTTRGEHSGGRLYWAANYADRSQIAVTFAHVVLNGSVMLGLTPPLCNPKRLVRSLKVRGDLSGD